MSLIAIGMNVFLAVLLLAALAMGWRLDRRLRTVRDSQAMFAKAVKDLDASTGRAQAGLAELRAATDEAIDLLGGRIVRAKEAADRLDRMISTVETLPAPAPRAAPAFERRPPEVREPEARAPQSRVGSRASIGPTDLHGLLELAETGRINGFAPLRAPAQRPVATPRMRPVDDDLFDDIGALR